MNHQQEIAFGLAEAYAWTCICGTTVHANAVRCACGQWRWQSLADRIESLARRQRCYGRYQRLIGELRSGRMGVDCEQRARRALATLSQEQVNV